MQQFGILVQRMRAQHMLELTGTGHMLDAGERHSTADVGGLVRRQRVRSTWGQSIEASGRMIGSCTWGLGRSTGGLGPCM